MHLTHNENTLDRTIRLFAGTTLFEFGYFWLGGTWSIVALMLGAILTVTGLVGYCPLYPLLHISTTPAGASTARRGVWVIIILVYLLAAAGGAYASVFFTSKFFLRDLNTVNDPYKQLLFNTGQGDREQSRTYLEALTVKLQAFQTTYALYRPYALRHDTQLTEDLHTIDATVASIAQEVDTGDLMKAHTTLESVRPVIQDILKRNGFSLLAVALVDFHDAMELVLTPADAKDAAGVLAAYPEADLKLKAIEAEANDDEIKTIRTNLEAVRTAAETNDVEKLPELAGALKSSFVKVYLARG